MAKHLQSFILPVSATIILPGIIVSWTKNTTSFWERHSNYFLIQLIVGATLIVFGSFLLITTVRLFVRTGKGTLAPWNPTRRLVVSGVYAYTRNPMISGVLFILLGEAIMFGSGGLFAWFLSFIAVNTVYFILSEEPGLEKRFKQEYVEYKRHVPRWIPQLKPWKGEPEQ